MSPIEHSLHNFPIKQSLTTESQRTHEANHADNIHEVPHDLRSETKSPERLPCALGRGVMYCEGPRHMDALQSHRYFLVRTPLAGRFRCSSRVAIIQGRNEALCDKPGVGSRVETNRATDMEHFGLRATCGLHGVCAFHDVPVHKHRGEGVQPCVKKWNARGRE